MTAAEFGASAPAEEGGPALRVCSQNQNRKASAAAFSRNAGGNSGPLGAECLPAAIGRASSGEAMPE